jgi:hypothetical protein
VNPVEELVHFSQVFYSVLLGFLSRYFLAKIAGSSNLIYRFGQYTAKLLSDAQIVPPAILAILGVIINSRIVTSESSTLNS